jgi:glucosamine-6-phosphate deaminase
MEIIIQKNREAASQAAAKVVVDKIRTKPDAVFGLASGESPLRLYEILVERENAGEMDFSNATFFTLDEYLGLEPQHPASYHYYFEKNFFSLLKRRPGRIVVPDGTTDDVAHFCASYENQIKSEGGIDLQILGIGQDGHLAFNEPGSSLVSRTRIKTLTPETLRANAKTLKGLKAKPKHVLTMGLATILEARQCVVLAFGEKKSKAVAGMAEGAVSASCPASVLQMHVKTQVFLDVAAAKLLKRRNYYQFVYENKPEWQR